MFKCVVASLLASSVAFGAHASVFTFDDFALQDTLVDQVTTSDGQITATLEVSANRNNQNSDVDRALIFDTQNGVDGDSDLQSGFLSDDGTRTSDAGGVLVIAENDLSNGQLPDDNQNGGVIVFMFDTLVTFTGFSIYDDASITVTSDNGATFSAEVDGNHRFDDFLIGDDRFAGSKILTFNFNGHSGAIDNLAVSAVPLPAGLVLLLGALGGLGMLRRRA